MLCRKWNHQRIKKIKLTKYTYTVQLPSGSAKSRAEAARSETADAALAALAAGLIVRAERI